jgi:hypothetical protein
LKHGAYINALDVSYKDFSTPLHKASSQGSHMDSIISLLIQYNADINIKDRYGKTPMDLYIEENLKNENEENKNIFPIRIVNHHNNKKQSSLFKNNLFCQPISIVNSLMIKNKSKKQDNNKDKDNNNDNEVNNKDDNVDNSHSLGILCNICNKYSLAFTRVKGSLVCTTCKFNMSHI